MKAMMIMYQTAGAVALMMLSLGISGCGVDDDEAALSKPGITEQAQSDSPVTIKVGTSPTATINDEDFQKLFVQPVKAKHPYITLELVRHGKGNQIQDQVTVGAVPDIVLIWNGALPGLKDLDLLEDMTPLIKKQNVDLNRFEQVYMDSIRTISAKGELYALPYAAQFNALYYNKDIFDRFGVPYPKEGMTWEDAAELAKKLTRSEGGVQYMGLSPDQVQRMAFPLSLQEIDAKANKANVDNEQYMKVFETAKSIYSIPGNRPATWGTQFKDFINVHNVAMLATINIFDRLQVAEKDGFTNWDVTQYPSYKDKPNVYGMVDAHTLVIPKTSKHKDAAMQVIATVVSDETQMVASKSTGRLTPLKNPEIKKAFGADIAMLKGKNVQAIFKSMPAPAPEYSSISGKQIIFDSFYEYLDGIKDVNTALREANEKINKLIQEKK